jgi:hypothetical protein
MLEKDLDIELRLVGQTIDFRIPIFELAITKDKEKKSPNKKLTTVYETR